jgi:putative hydrolase of the HAD superfamily
VISAVLLDLGNVLVRFDHGITLRALASETGRSAEELRPIVFGALERDFDLGRVSRLDFFRSVERSAGLPRIPDESWIRAWRDIFEPIPAAVALVGRLAPGIRKALVSNTNELHWEGVLRVADVRPLFDVTALSFQVGSVKPDPRIFRSVLTGLSCLPTEAVFADDREDYVSAARELGLDAFVVEGPESLSRGLEGRGLLVPRPRSGMT